MTQDKVSSTGTTNKSAKKEPEFMQQASREHIRASMTEYRDIWVAAATFGNLKTEGWEDRLTLVVTINEVLETNKAAEWSQAIMATHHKYGSLQDVGPVNNLDKLARSFYLRAALIHLLDIVEAPSSFKDDVSRWLNHKMPKVAPKRGNVQAALIDHPELADDPASLAEKANCSRRLVDRYLVDGSIQRMP